MTFKMPRSYSGRVCMLFGGVSGGENFHGPYSGTAYAKGSVVGTFTGSAHTRIGTASGSPEAGEKPGTPGAPPRR
jgi:hypothetical protein